MVSEGLDHECVYDGQSSLLELLFIRRLDVIMPLTCLRFFFF